MGQGRPLKVASHADPGGKVTAELLLVVSDAAQPRGDVVLCEDPEAQVLEQGPVPWHVRDPPHR